MRIVFMGTPEFSVNILEAIKNNVVLVVTQPDKLVGRKQTLLYSPVKKKALELNIRCFQPIKIKDDYQLVIDANPDIIITAAYGQMIPKQILLYPCFNIHASLLPKYRGGAPIHKAIMNGDKVTGITILKMVPKMDAGDIIAQRMISITDFDNNTAVFEKLSILGRDLLIEILDNILLINPLKQDENLVTYAYNITHEEEKIDWEKEGIEIYNHIRGLAMTPGAYCFYQDKKIKIYASKFESSDYQGLGGEIIILDKKLGIQVKGGIIYPSLIQMEGKTMMDIQSFLNGNRQLLKVNTFFK